MDFMIFRQFRNNCKYLTILFILAILSGCQSSSNTGTITETAPTSPTPMEERTNQQMEVGTKPAVFEATQTIPPKAEVKIMGVQLLDLSQPIELDAAENVGAVWNRGLSIPWSAVEPEPGSRNWEILAGFEQNILTLQAHHITPIVAVVSTPSWAQKTPGYSCGPILPDQIPAFARFTADVVARYSQPPFDVRFWEIWNEPDVDPVSVSGDSPFGCWGNRNDPDFGGSAFGEMLSAVYPQVKAVDPDAQVLVGGLLMECDPEHLPTKVNPANPGCVSAHFLEGILKQGDGNNFDGVSFHAYDYYGGKGGKVLGNYSNGNWASDRITGPVLTAKANYLKKTLANYGVEDKYLMNTEVALLCDDCGPGTALAADFEQTKANYAAISYATAKSVGLRANVWYSMMGWRNSGLIDSEGNPLLVYKAFKFASQEIGKASFGREATLQGGVKSYEFRDGQRLIWLVCSPATEQATIELPTPPTAAYSVTGEPIPASLRMTIGTNPVYIEWNP